MNTIHPAVCLHHPKYLWFLMLCYTVAILLANWFDVRLIRIFSLDTDAGTLIFPFTFLLADLITEVYGYQQARRAIWCGFLFNIIFIVYSQIVIALPSPDYAVVSNNSFHDMLALNKRIIIASISSYFCSEPLNALLVAKLKIRFKGTFLGLRYVSSTFIAAGVDSLLFGLIAFGGLIPKEHLLTLIATMWFFKVFIELLGLPLSLFLTGKLKKLEQIDIYDQHTNFSLFRFEVNYTQDDNRYK